MLILSRVCVEFRSLRGIPLFSVTPAMLNTFQEAPDSIREDPIFNLLIEDGSLEAVVPEKKRKELENDPIQDTDASGKRRKNSRGKEKVEEMDETSKASTSVFASASVENEKKTEVGRVSATVTKESKVPSIKKEEESIDSVSSNDNAEKKAVRK